jgi:hypothetical protein
VDTYSVNLSAEAHEAAAAFYTVLVPVSAGSPQELAFAESVLIKAAVNNCLGRKPNPLAL